MKTLTQAWELIQLLSSLHFLSPSLVRTANPQTYTFYCSYSEERINESIFESNHIVKCEDSNCEYYKRIEQSKDNLKSLTVWNSNLETRETALSLIFLGPFSPFFIKESCFF